MRASGPSFGAYSMSGFNVYAFDNSQSPFVEVKIALSGNPIECTSNNSHGCVVNWDPSGPGGRIFMNDQWLNQGRHKQSDLMHEMGHVLLNANEHYPAYNCSSIMGHSSSEAQGSVGQCGTAVPNVSDTLISVQDHDRSDYQDIFGVKDAPDATYVQMVGSGTLKHYFEGGYFGGVGHTLHQEAFNWIDRSTSGLGGTYSSYQSPGRKVDNEDDTTPESDSYAAVPASGSEWCFKRRGRAGGVSTSNPYYWGPLSKAYCIRQSSNGSGVFIATNRNDYVLFQIWNYSGSTINFLSILLSNGTHVCDFADLPSGQSTYCIWYPGNSSGFVNLWYGLVQHGSVGYDTR